MKKNNNKFISYQAFLNKSLESNKTIVTDPKNYKEINKNHFISYQPLDKNNVTDTTTNITIGADVVSPLDKNNVTDTTTEKPNLKNLDTDSYQGKPIEIKLEETKIDFEQTLSWQKFAQLFHIALSIFPPSDLQKFLPPSDLQKIFSFFDAISDDAKNVNRIPLVPGYGFSDKRITKENKEEAAAAFKKVVKDLLENIIPGYKPIKPYELFLDKNRKKNSHDTSRGG